MAERKGARTGDHSLAGLRIGIVGLGLMGGSLAMALRGHAGRLSAVEPAPLARQIALREGIVDSATESLAAGVQEVDLLVLATPVRTILNVLNRLPALRPDGCLVLDLGSTKQAVCAAMSVLPEPFAAAGGHPMCGKETAGITAATPDLYRGQTFILCRTERTTAAAEAIALQVVEAIGARPFFLEAEEHDRLVAAVSHLPVLLSAALMRHADSERQWQVSASGFRDASRLSGSDPRMMLDILMTNRAAVLVALEEVDADLAELRRLLEQADEGGLSEWLAAAQVRHAAYRRFRSAGDLETGGAPGEPG